MNNYNFSVYHQVYNNKEWTQKSLSSILKFYPNVKIQILCDGGVDYSDVAKQFNAEYVYDSFNVGIYCNLNPKVVSGEHIYGWTKDESLIFLKRIYDFAKKCNTKYFLFNEDDIIYNSKFTINNEEFDLTGRIPANFFPENFLVYVKKIFPKSNLEQWGCCAGNFLKTESFIYCYENSINFLENNYDFIIHNIFDKLGWNDVLFNFLFGINGMSYIRNYDYSETDSSFPIYHDKITSRVRNN